jgi:orotate phosphoribosyltransferase
VADDFLLSTIAMRRGHFVLESGHHSDVWLDLEALCLRPRAVQPLAAELAAKLRPHDVDAVCGPLNEGAFVAMMVASALDCEFTYAERFVRSRDGLFPVEYDLPNTLHEHVRGKRVAIVNDVTSAGSAVRGTLASLQRLDARIGCIASLIVLGDAMKAFAREHAIPLEYLQHVAHNQWTPSECPLCRDGVSVQR